MKIENIMTKNVFSLKEENKLIDCALLMKNKNIGAIPIIDDDLRVIGIVTDRDIVIGLAKGFGHETLVTKFMTKRVETLHETDSLLDLTELMGYSQIRRVPIVDYNEKLVGMVSLGDLSLVTFSDNFASEALAEISFDPNKMDYFRPSIYDI